MKLFGILKADTIKIFTTYGFYISVFFTVLLCLSSPVFTDQQRKETYSVITLLSQFDKNAMPEHPEMNSFTVAMKGNWGWLSLFIPIIAGFIFVPILCDEYNFGAVRYFILRSSNFRYYTTKFVMSCIFGGLAVMIGYGIYIGIVYSMFPGIGLFRQELQELIEQESIAVYPVVSYRGYRWMPALKLGEIFLYGVFSTVSVVFLSSFVRNKYLVLCIPFFSSIWDNTVLYENKNGCIE